MSFESWTGVLHSEVSKILADFVRFESRTGVLHSEVSKILASRFHILTGNAYSLYRVLTNKFDKQ